MQHDEKNQEYGTMSFGQSTTSFTLAKSMSHQPVVNQQKRQNQNKQGEMLMQFSGTFEMNQMASPSLNDKSDSRLTSGNDSSKLSRIQQLQQPKNYSNYA